MKGGVKMLEDFVNSLPTMEDGSLLARFHFIIRECLKRDSISVSYLSKYPMSAAAQKDSAPTAPNSASNAITPECRVCRNFKCESRGRLPIYRSCFVSV